MRQFKHPNIITLHDMITPSSVEGFNDVYIITELMSRDLQEVGSYTCTCKHDVNTTQHNIT